MKTPEYFKRRYGVDSVLFTDELADTFTKLRASKLLIMNGKGTGG